jgi:hypothetical protein
MVSLTPALEDSNQTHDPHERDVITVAGVSDSPTTPAVPELGARDQNIDSSCEAANTAHTAKPSAYSRLVLDNWVCETVAMVFSNGCVVAIAFTVGYHNSDPIPTLPSGVTLNALISVLSTAARAALFFVVSSSIGQLKWCWLIRRDRRLQDIQVMDEASRGPLGAIWVLVRWTGGPLATLGATITICMIAFSPFLQQLVAYPTDFAEQSSPEATVPRAVNSPLLWWDVTNVSYHNRLVEGGDGLGNLLQAYDAFGPQVFTPVTRCPTTQCTWTGYKSVGWCSKCRKTSGRLIDCVAKDHLTDPASNASEYLTSRHFCQITVGNPETPSVSAPYLMQQSRVPTDLRTISLTYWTDHVWAVNVSTFVADDHTVIERPIITFTHAVTSPVENVFQDLYNSDQPALRIDHINQCVLTLCERTYNAETKDGITDWKVTFTDYGKRFRSGSCWRPEDSADDVVLTSTDEGRTCINETERASCPVGTYHAWMKQIGMVDTTRNWLYNFTHSYQGPDDSSSQLDRDPRSYLKGLATSLTNYGTSLSNLSAVGKAFLPVVTVHVRWQWISLPALLELASVILFLSTIIYSRRIGVPIWKSSLLAISYHQVEDLREDRAIFRLSEMDKASNDASVQISRSGDAQGFMLRRVRDGGALREGRDQE